MLKDYKDFKMGVAPDLQPQEATDDMLADAQNMYWNGGPKKRHGYKDIHSFGAGTVVVGHYHTYVESEGMTLIALMTTATSVVTFYEDYDSATGVLTEIDATFTWSGSAAITVQFCGLDQEWVIVDKSGTNKPAVIYIDTTVKIATLDAYDERDIDNAFWFAGQYDESEGEVAAAYIDDTTDAQSAAESDFNLATATAKDGFWISSNQKFSKIVFTMAEQMAGTPVAAWTYWNGSAWTALTVAGITWTAAEADRTGTFTPPDAWALFEEFDGVDSNGDTSAGSLFGNYVVRCSFTTAPTAAKDCDKIAVDLDLAVTNAFGVDIPTRVAIHNSRVYMASENAVLYSRYGEVKGWETRFAEYFSDGGDTINQLVSMDKQLCVVKDNALFMWSGTDPDTFTLRKAASIGTSNGESCAVVNGLMFFERQSKIFIFGGSSDPIDVSKHIETLITTDGWGVAYKGMYWYISSTKILVTDPDLIKKDDVGDGIASWWPFELVGAGYTNPVVYSRANHFGTDGATDTNLADSLVVAEADDLRCLDYGTQYFDDADVAIEMYLETIPFFMTHMGQNKTLKRVKAIMNQAVAWTFTITGENGNTVAITVASGAAASTRYIEEASIPYTIDSESFAFTLKNDTVNNAEIYGFTCELVNRRF